MKTAIKKTQLYVVKARKGVIVIKQTLTSADQAERWKDLVILNGYEVIE